MPSGMVRSFTDPDAYAHFVPSTKVDLTITARGQFGAKVTLIALDNVWMQRFSDNLPRLAHSAASKGRAIISFRTELGPSLAWGGLEMTPQTILMHNEAHDSFQRSSGRAAWGSISMPVATLATVGSIAAGQDMSVPKNSTNVTPSTLAMARLQAIHAEVGRLAETNPAIFANAEAVKGIEQTMMGAMIGCFGLPNSHRTTIARGRHHLVMRKFNALLEADPARILYVPEVSTLIGVSARTLRECSQEHLGMGIMRYLLLRRLHLARRALRNGVVGVTSVTDVAMNHGFWELGRFSVGYKALFGESPSATLRQS